MVIGALRHPKILIPAGPESSWQLNGAAEAAAPSKLTTQQFSASCEAMPFQNLVAGDVRILRDPGEMQGSHWGLAAPRRFGITALSGARAGCPRLHNLP